MYITAPDDTRDDARDDACDYARHYQFFNRARIQEIVDVENELAQQKRVHLTLIKEHRHRESKEKRKFERATAAAAERKAKEAVAEAEGTVVAPVRPSRQNVPLPMNPETVPSEADRLEKEVIKFELSAEMQASH